MNQEELRQELAAYAHDTWIQWMDYVFSKSTELEDGTVVIPADLVERWKWQMSTQYESLPVDMQKSDLAEADKMLHIMRIEGFGKTK